MSEYIDKQELLESLEKSIKEANLYRMAVVDRDFIDLIKDCTVIDDVVEVVRCKDCEYWDKQSDSIQGKCTLFVDYPFYPTGSWYCANSERKENEQ